MKKYYYAASERIGMRTGGTVSYILGDHLGSSSVVIDAAGNMDVAGYKPWGEVRYGSLPTKYTYTGQYSNMSEFGLMYYNARWYDPALGRFVQADTIVPQPGDVRGWDRYAYVENNPLRYTDPSGHFCVEIGGVTTCSKDDDSRGYWYCYVPIPMMSEINQNQMLENAVAGDQVVYRRDGVDYHAEFVYQTDSEWVLWDFRSRAPIGYKEISSSVIGFYSYNVQTHNYDLHWGLTEYEAELAPKIFYIPGEWYVGEEYMVKKQTTVSYYCDLMCQAGFVVSAAGAVVALGLVVSGPEGWIVAGGIADAFGWLLTFGNVGIQLETKTEIVPIQEIYFQEP